MDETTTEKTDAGVNITPAEIVQPLGERMPPVTEGQQGPGAPSVTTENPAIAKTEIANDPYENARDAHGNIFRRSRHMVGDDGAPLLSKSGHFRIRREYREGLLRKGLGENSTERPAPSFNAPGASGVASAVNGTSPAILSDEYDAAAEVYLQSAYGPVIIAFSEHARPDKEEHSALKVAVANYLRVKQITEPSPGWALLFTVSAVAVKKSEHPEVRERAKTLWERISKGSKTPKLT